MKKTEYNSLQLLKDSIIHEQKRNTSIVTENFSFSLLEHVVYTGTC